MGIKTPFVAVDGIIQLFDSEDRFRGIVLIERKNPPLGLAIPGGFVDVGERVEDALIREMKEETDLDVEIVRLLGVYSDPDRDPRFHTVSITYVCKAYGEPKAQSDAKDVKIFRLEDIPFDKLVFDHAKILKDYLLR
ncbi:MAG TPA: NUDIX hydrolase [Persephonella sp.]|uniref:Adp-ribose pyrophosphatase (Adp-ribose diphosphatase)(Adenosine diphosphoribose pyrophosphatase) (Adpr-ppase) (Adp-ribosephosphohydrolase) n=1 Tax=Persephonella marina (strain DSM 14350 / EX-H1) TaxID=123214 RepID=C0QQT0_PERMH|nr:MULTISPECIES: NUDIX hydrolase [Persephonella]ACO04312.1 adp-ribose pyrophosphatase (adp-ribose diphosphatase)(adenosine diphosphoribose pyrophosphatase) (adpr-ppase) (adp-ribosephosphohydrolase) [Persephonella marina EX-H1]HCB68776.1 NUDIX hydrolase [Persephonella sp.]